MLLESNAQFSDKYVKGLINGLKTRFGNDLTTQRYGLDHISAMEKRGWSHLPRPGRHCPHIRWSKTRSLSRHPLDHHQPPERLSVASQQHHTATRNIQGSTTPRTSHSSQATRPTRQDCQHHAPCHVRSTTLAIELLQPTPPLYSPTPLPHLPQKSTLPLPQK